MLGLIVSIWEKLLGPTSSLRQALTTLINLLGCTGLIGHKLLRWVGSLWPELPRQKQVYWNKNY